MRFLGQNLAIIKYQTFLPLRCRAQYAYVYPFHQAYFGHMRICSAFNIILWEHKKAHMRRPLKILIQNPNSSNIYHLCVLTILGTFLPVFKN